MQQSPSGTVRSKSAQHCRGDQRAWLTWRCSPRRRCAHRAGTRASASACFHHSCTHSTTAQRRPQGQRSSCRPMQGITPADEPCRHKCACKGVHRELRTEQQGSSTQPSIHSAPGAKELRPSAHVLAGDADARQVGPTGVPARANLMGVVR